MDDYYENFLDGKAMIVIPYVAAVAQDRVPLQRDKLDSMAPSKKWTYVRADGAKIFWDLRSGGNPFANNRTSGRSDSGTWSVNDQGHLCTEWRGNSQNTCFVLFKDGGKLKRVSATEATDVAVD